MSETQKPPSNRELIRRFCAALGAFHSVQTEDKTDSWFENLRACIDTRDEILRRMKEPETTNGKG